MDESMDQTNRLTGPLPHEREQALFVAALERPAAERAAFLDSACQGDPVLRSRIAALLAAHDKPAKEMAGETEDGGDTNDNPSTMDEAVGRTIGRYKLLERV